MSNFLTDTMEVLGKESIAAFRLMQVTSIGQTIMKTYEAAQNAYASLSAIPIIGPGLGIAAAAVATTAGLLRVEQIRRQKPPAAEEGAFVKSGGLAELHTGERVLNKDETANLAAPQVINLVMNDEIMATWVKGAEESKEQLTEMGTI